MSFTPALKGAFDFKNDAHAIASALTSLHGALQFIEAKAGVINNAKTEATVETITAFIPGVGAQAVVIERAGFAALGIVLSLIKVLDAADEATLAALKAKLADVGLDEATISSFKAFADEFKGDLNTISGIKLAA